MKSFEVSSETFKVKRLIAIEYSCLRYKEGTNSPLNKAFLPLIKWNIFILNEELGVWCMMDSCKYTLNSGDLQHGIPSGDYTLANYLSIVLKFLGRILAKSFPTLT